MIEIGATRTEKTTKEQIMKKIAIIRKRGLVNKEQLDKIISKVNELYNEQQK